MSEPTTARKACPSTISQIRFKILLMCRKNKEKQQAIGLEIARRRTEARRLRAEAERVVTKAKARVERMILGKEESI